MPSERYVMLAVCIAHADDHVHHDKDADRLQLFARGPSTLIHACTGTGFFPYPANGAWDTAYDAAFSRDVLASFNQTRFDFDGFKALYTSFNTTIGQTFKDFQHGFLKTLGVPSSSGDKGGFVYLSGWEGGLTALDTEAWFEDATFAVVEETADGGRTITEFREASNIPNTAPLPPSQDWGCALP